RVMGIAVVGPPGSGKSTLAAALQRRLPEAAVLAYDDYETLTGEGPERIAAWLDGGADPEQIDLAAFVGAAARLSRGETVRAPDGTTMRAGRFLVIDTPFGRRHAATAPFIDLEVWLDLPLDMALARKIRQFAGWASAD